MERLFLKELFIAALWGALFLTVVGIVLLIAYGIRFFQKRQQVITTWERSPDGLLYREAHGSWLLAKARLEHAAPLPVPPVVRAWEYKERSGRYVQHRYTEMPCQQVQMRVQMLLVGGQQLTSEGVVTVPVAELGDLVPGHIFSVLYDPNDPRRFYIDTLRRQNIMMDGPIHRTRVAEEQLRAAQAFHQPAPPQGQPPAPW
ncbi:hypothetical protein [Chondromyces crocatus]|uniref:Uncharacterized protein n=1 Tax=Chondromyces crocatus TaxID=52 RepID=A0A0K1EJD6_CHOCO|nr:hypothetical protein [Chondromyces crocatus]AKT40787.1 uncharacterized protein CMC5_049430 [Chondromyces crocatus]